jgi:hypothetical protein
LAPTANEEKRLVLAVGRKLVFVKRAILKLVRGGSKGELLLARHIADVQKSTLRLGECRETLTGDHGISDEPLHI